MSEKYNIDDLNKVSMKIILHAGDARNQIKNAMGEIKKQNFNKAKELLSLANDNLKKAHESQTKVIQDAASGIELPFSVLFTHAQDTLMTIMSEYNMAQQMMDVFHEVLFKEHKDE